MNVCQNTQAITIAEVMPNIKTVGWLRQIRIPIEKDSDGNDITPGLKTFLEKGSMRKPGITVGDTLTDEVHQVGILSDMRIGAEEALNIKRRHWKIENSLHHVLDDVFCEDRSCTRRSKNNLALVRKFAYNILKIACIQDNTGKGVREMSDIFADKLEVLAQHSMYPGAYPKSAKNIK